MRRTSMLVVGLDGCGEGWVAVALQEGTFDSARFVAAAGDALDLYPSAEVIGIDIPIGIEPRRFRPVDARARALLGTRGSTLFETPPLEALRKPTYQGALARCLKLTGKGLSRQAYALRVKILEVAQVVAKDDRFIEVHPELSFRKLAGETLPERKKSWNGLTRRRRLLEEAGIVVPDTLGEAGALAGPDDVVDAAAAAWTANRKRRGVAERVVALPEDQATTGAAIWY